MPVIEIKRFPNNSLKLSFKSSIIHASNTAIIYCLFHEYSYSLPVSRGAFSLTVFNNSHTNSTCITEIDWDPSKVAVTAIVEFAYSLQISQNQWVVKSKKGTIINYNIISGKFQ